MKTGHKNCIFCVTSIFTGCHESKYCRMEEETLGENYSLGDESKGQKEEKKEDSTCISLNEHRNSRLLIF